MHTYTTTEVAKVIGIHSNTVRMYEAWGLIPQAERKANGYRIFTDFHIEQLRLSALFVAGCLYLCKMRRKMTKK